MSRFAWNCVVAIIVTSCAQTAFAQAAITQARAQLATHDATQIRAGIEALAVTSSPAAVDAIATRIRQGLTPDLLDVALDALTVIARPEAGPILFELATHRRAAVRIKAIQAIVACKPNGADTALIAALEDADPTVRGASAIGLGTLKSRRSVDALFLAFERGVLEAAASIGQIAAPEQVGRLLDALGRVAFDTMKPALSEVLARRDIPERVKLEVITRLGDLATVEVKTYLEEFVASLPPNDRSNLRRVATETAARISN